MSGDQRPLVMQIETEDQMHRFGVRLGELLVAGDLVCLNGPLGAGKTTLTRGIGEGLEVIGNISSPTFLIARSHETKSGVAFNHLDAYRLSDVSELDDLDIDFSGSISVIEWGAGFAEGLVESMLEITIEPDLQTEIRTLKVSGTGRFSDPKNFLGEA